MRIDPDLLAAEVRRLQNVVAGYTDGISAGSESNKPYEQNDATVGERLVERISLTQTLLDDNGRLRAEIASLRLTAEEREAIELFAALNWTSLRWSKVEKNAATLRKLLERLS